MKKFLIIGNMNAISYREMFPLIKDNRIWPGAVFNKTMEFYIPSGEFRGVPACWYTNLISDVVRNPLRLTKKYSPADYPFYDNYDAIEVSKTSDIPMDYDGVMGVPITFLDKYCPEQFEIIWQASGNTRVSAPVDVLSSLSYHPHKEDRGGCPVIDGKRMYSRILIRHKR